MDWLKKVSYKLQLKVTRKLCRDLIKINKWDDVPFIEVQKMAEIAEVLIPKLDKELSDLERD